MKQILAVTAFVAILSTSAFAQSSALDVRNQLSTYVGGDTAIVDMFMDETGKDRDDADYEARMKAMTPEQVEIAKGACTKADAEKITFSDMVASRCKAILTPKS